MRIKEACRDKTDRGIRFSDLFRTIPHISEKVLASTLNYLEGEGLVERTSYESMPPCVEYSLTPLAQNFLREIRTMLMIGNIRECHLISLTCTGNKKPPHFEYLPYIPFIIPFDSLVILTTIHYLYLYVASCLFLAVNMLSFRNLLIQSKNSLQEKTILWKKNMQRVCLCLSL